MDAKGKWAPKPKHFLAHPTPFSLHPLNPLRFPILFLIDGLQVLLYVINHLALLVFFPKL